MSSSPNSSANSSLHVTPVSSPPLSPSPPVLSSLSETSLFASAWGRRGSLLFNQPLLNEAKNAIEAAKHTPHASKRNSTSASVGVSFHASVVASPPSLSSISPSSSALLSSSSAIGSGPPLSAPPQHLFPLSQAQFKKLESKFHSFHSNLFQARAEDLHCYAHMSSCASMVNALSLGPFLQVMWANILGLLHGERTHLDYSGLHLSLHSLRVLVEFWCPSKSSRWTPLLSKLKQQVSTLDLSNNCVGYSEQTATRSHDNTPRTSRSNTPTNRSTGLVSSPPSTVSSLDASSGSGPAPSALFNSPVQLLLHLLCNHLSLTTINLANNALKPHHIKQIINGLSKTNIKELNLSSYNESERAHVSFDPLKAPPVHDLQSIARSAFASIYDDADVDDCPLSLSCKLNSVGSLGASAFVDLWCRGNEGHANSQKLQAIRLHRVVPLFIQKGGGTQQQQNSMGSQSLLPLIQNALVATWCKIEVLDLSSNGLHSSLLTHLFNSVCSMSCLKVLDVSFNDFDESMDVVERLGNCIAQSLSLQTVHLNNCNIPGVDHTQAPQHDQSTHSHSSFRSFFSLLGASLLKSNSVHSLYLDSNPLLSAPSNLDTMCQGFHMSNLKLLSLKNCNLGGKEYTPRTSRRASVTSNISINDAVPSSPPSSALATCNALASLLGHSSTLLHLDLTQNQLDASVVAAMCAALKRNTKIRLSTLLLGNNRLGDDGTLALAELLQSNRTLRELQLHSNRIKHESMEHLIKSCADTQSPVTKLTFYGNFIGDELSEVFNEILKKKQLHEKRQNIEQVFHELEDEFSSVQSFPLSIILCSSTHSIADSIRVPDSCTTIAHLLQFTHSAVLEHNMPIYIQINHSKFSALLQARHSSTNTLPLTYPVRDWTTILSVYQYIASRFQHENILVQDVVCMRYVRHDSEHPHVMPAESNPQQQHSDSKVAMPEAPSNMASPSFLMAPNRILLRKSFNTDEPSHNHSPTAQAIVDSSSASSSPPPPSVNALSSNHADNFHSQQSSNHFQLHTNIEKQIVNAKHDNSSKSDTVTDSGWKLHIDSVDYAVPPVSSPFDASTAPVHSPGNSMGASDASSFHSTSPHNESADRDQIIASSSQHIDNTFLQLENELKSQSKVKHHAFLTPLKHRAQNNSSDNDIPALSPEDIENEQADLAKLYFTIGHYPHLKWRSDSRVPAPAQSASSVTPLKAARNTLSMAGAAQIDMQQSASKRNTNNHAHMEPSPSARRRQVAAPSAHHSLNRNSFPRDASDSSRDRHASSTGLTGVSVPFGSVSFESSVSVTRFPQIHPRNHVPLVNGNTTSRAATRQTHATAKNNHARKHTQR